MENANKVAKLASARKSAHEIRNGAIMDMGLGLFLIILFVYIYGQLSMAEAIQPGATRGIANIFLWFILFPIGILGGGALNLYHAVKIDNALRELEK